MIRRPPRSPLLPDTALFRSGRRAALELLGAQARLAARPGALRVRPDRVVDLARRPRAPPPARRSSRGHLDGLDRKSTRLNSSHANIWYAVFCLTKKAQTPNS